MFFPCQNGRDKQVDVQRLVVRRLPVNRAAVLARVFHPGSETAGKGVVGGFVESGVAGLEMNEVTRQAGLKPVGGRGVMVNRAQNVVVQSAFVVVHVQRLVRIPGKEMFRQLEHVVRVARFGRVVEAVVELVFRTKMLA